MKTNRTSTTDLELPSWGKRRATKGNIETARLGLAEHSADVAAVFEALIALPTMRQRLVCLTQVDLTDQILARLSVLAFLHDIGKTSAGFQSKALPDSRRASWLAKHGLQFNQCGHTRTVARLFFNNETRRLFAGCFPFAEIIAWGPATTDLWFASISHHGTPIMANELQSSREMNHTAVWRKAGGYDPMAAIRHLGECAISWFPAAWQNTQAPLPEEAPFVHAFAGLISLADWIASNDAEGFFPFHGHGTGDRMTFARQRAQSVLKQMRIDIEDVRAELQNRRPDFGEVFRESNKAYAPTDLQSAMVDRDLGNLVIAESETGSGKTEAALWRFKTLFAAGEVDSLAFLLPTRVAAVAMEQRIGAFLQALFPDERLRPNIVLAVPGYLKADGDVGRRNLLARFEVLWPDSEDNNAAHRRWAAESAKRYLAAAISVGTVDQVLLTGLMTRHAHLRGAALLRSLIVVDEVHASDAYMTQLLLNVLKRHADAGGHALLLSATLGSDARNLLLKEKKHRLASGQTRAPKNDDDPVDAPFPAVSDQKKMHRIAETGQSKHVQILLTGVIDAPNDIAECAATAVKTGAKVLVIRNTVGGAIAVQEALEHVLGPDHPALFRVSGIACPHHGRFAAADRRVLDQAVEDAFGKSAGRGATVLAGTQTLEQSLDIDADLLITDLAPADILLQRIGRLHRHERHDRPAGYREPKVVILTPQDRDLTPFLAARRGLSGHGLGSVYDNILSVEATWRILESTLALTIPADNRCVVEAVTRQQVLEEIANELGGAWPENWQKYQGLLAAARGGAEAIKLDWSVAWDDQPWAEPGEIIRTRLGLGDRLANLAQSWMSPFGQQIKQFKIPGWMVEEDAPEEAELADIVDNSISSLSFTWGNRMYRYTRYGLELSES